MVEVLPIGHRASWARRRTEYDSLTDHSLEVVTAPRKQPCFCDRYDCPRSQLCRQLGEYRLAYRVIEDIMKHSHHPEHNNIVTVQDLLSEIMSECEILVK